MLYIYIHIIKIIYRMIYHHISHNIYIYIWSHYWNINNINTDNPIECISNYLKIYIHMLSCWTQKQMKSSIIVSWLLWLLIYEMINVYLYINYIIYNCNINISYIIIYTIYLYNINYIYWLYWLYCIHVYCVSWLLDRLQEGIHNLGFGGICMFGLAKQEISQQQGSIHLAIALEHLTKNSFVAA